MFALVDCNNFYVSCERLFCPRLQNKPVVVLSNNDGCVISRSQEAKDLGIQMGAPAYLIDGELKKHNVVSFSSNYALYINMNRRVMNTIRSFENNIEVYSIDEAFINFANCPADHLNSLALKIKAAVTHDVGIPVGVGVAPTKTLAKLANRFAKKTMKEVSVYTADTPEKVETMLKWAEISDVWGIGSQHAKRLKEHGYKTAFDLLSANEDWIRDKMSVVGLRLLKELKGIPCNDLLQEPPKKKVICCARGYGQLLTAKKDIQAATAGYAARVGEKLRGEGLCCTRMEVFVTTNEHRKQDLQYNTAVEIKIPVATNNTSELIGYAMQALDMLYRPGYNYHKSGVTVTGMVPQHEYQVGMFDRRDRKKDGLLMAALDNINVSYGKDAMRYAVQLHTNKWKMRTAKLSPVYTRWDEMLKVK